MTLLAVLYSCGNVANSFYFFRMNVQADTKFVYFDFFNTTFITFRAKELHHEHEPNSFTKINNIKITAGSKLKKKNKKTNYYYVYNF